MNDRIKSILEHMLEDSQDIVTLINETDSFETFCRDMKTRKAVIMSLLNIGELANQSPN